MTMRVSSWRKDGVLSHEPSSSSPALDPEKNYSFTWPGQERRTASGAELLALLKGANAEMLDIEEAT